MQQPGRKFNAGSEYRYGFNGKENMEELNAHNYDFEARIYDGRIGRWLSVDPHQTKYPGLSPYNFSANSPVFFKDSDGRDIIISVWDDKSCS